jgi:hypothetical protein
MFGAFALLHAAFALAALSFAPALPLVAIPLFVVECITAYDNLIIVAGRRIGFGAAALRLNRMRFFLHAVCIGLLVPVYTGLGAALGIDIFSAAAATPVAFSVALAIGAFGYGVQYRKLGTIVPVNYYGCLRYSQAVDPQRRYPGYEYTEAQLAQRPLPPFASIITVLIGLIVSFWIGWSAGFWVPFGVTALMFAAAGFPPKTWGPLVTSALEIVYSGGLVWSLSQLQPGV